MENLPGVIDFKPFAPSLLKKRVHGYSKTKKLNVSLIMKGRNAEIHKTYRSMFLLFDVSVAKINLSETLPRSRQKFERKSTRSKLA